MAVAEVDWFAGQYNQYN